MNVLLKAPEIEFQLRDSGAAVLITSGAVAHEAAQAAGAAVRSIYVADPAAYPVPGASFDDLLAGDPPGPRLVPVSPAEPAVIIYTSGTTGAPKGAVLSHFTLYMNADISGRLFEFEDSDVVRPGIVSGSVLRGARLSAGISEAQLAATAGVPEGTAREWECGSAPLAAVLLPDIERMQDVLVAAGQSHLSSQISSPPPGVTW